jgi:hypothetical protein
MSCLESLSKQVQAPSIEVIVPYDDTVTETGSLQERFPSVRFLPLGSLCDPAAVQNAFTTHKLYDRRRAAGLHAARARLVAILEDRGRPQPNWARSMVDLHENSSYSVIGGPIENGGTGFLRWAVYFCDFGRYQAPLEQEDPEYVSDVNICYKRDALESVRELWERDYQEPAVNWALRRRGMRLYLSERPVVMQHRGNTNIWKLLHERFHWGRMYGQIRGRDIPPFRCLMFAAATPVLPILLFVRHFRRQLHKRRNIRQFLRVTPATILLLHFWALGEFAGYCEIVFAGQRPAD